MFLQVTNKNLLFNYRSFDLQENYSIHLEIRSLKENISYLLIYKFDSKPKLTSSIKDIHGWDLLCFENKDKIFTYFLNNNQTSGYRPIIFGIRELSIIEMKSFCGTKKLDSLTRDDIVEFSSDYEIRAYLSACFYLDEENKWKSNGLLVSHFR